MALSSGPKGDPGLLPIYQDLLLLSNHTPETVKGMFDSNQVYNVEVFKNETFMLSENAKLLKVYTNFRSNVCG